MAGRYVNRAGCKEVRAGRKTVRAGRSTLRNIPCWNAGLRFTTVCVRRIHCARFMLWSPKIQNSAFLKTAAR